jgi:hypothetical protein
MEVGVMDAITKAVEATKRILGHVAESDFVTDFGHRAAYGIRDYKIDIAVDIFFIYEGREPTDDEKVLMTEADWGFIIASDGS